MNRWVLKSLPRLMQHLKIPLVSRCVSLISYSMSFSPGSPCLVRCSSIKISIATDCFISCLKKKSYSFCVLSSNPPIRLRFSFLYHYLRSLSIYALTSPDLLPLMSTVLLTNFLESWTMLFVNHPSSERDLTFSWVRNTTMKSLLGLIGLWEMHIGIIIELVSLFIAMMTACNSLTKSWKFSIGTVSTRISCFASRHWYYEFSVKILIDYLPP